MAGDPGTRSTRSRPSLCWPACRRRSARARPEILEHGPPGRGPALLASMPATIGDTFTTRPGCRSVWTAAGAIGTGGGSWNTSTRSRPSLRWPACRRRSATRSPRGRAVNRCGRPRAPSARPEILEHGPPGQGPRFAGQHAGDDRRHVHHAAGLSIGVDGPGTAAGTIGTAGDPGTRSTRSRPSLCWPACRRRSARGKGGRKVFRSARQPQCPKFSFRANLEGGVP